MYSFSKRIGFEEAAMNRPEYQTLLENFVVLKSKFDKTLFQYGPIFLLLEMLISILIFLFASSNPFGFRYTFPWYELNFYLFAMLVLILEIYVARDFFENIPRTFMELRKRNAMKGLKNNRVVSQRFASFLLDFQQKLNYPVPLILGSIIEVIILFVLQRSSLFPIIFLPTKYPLSALLINFLTVFLPMTMAGYMISIVIWKCFVTGYVVYKFSNILEITVQPSHPDKAGGLKPLGDLIFSMALILIVASLALSILTFASQINAILYKLLITSSGQQIQVPYYLISTEGLAKFSLGIAILLSLIVFFLPLFSAHRRMRAGKIILLASFTDIGNKITELEKKTQNVNLDYKERNEAFAEITSLSKVYEVLYRTPVWPFDRDILIKFFTPQVISLLSLLGVVQPIIDAISSWVK